MNMFNEHIINMSNNRTQVNSTRRKDVFMLVTVDGWAVPANIILWL